MIHNKNNTLFIKRDIFQVEFAPKKSPQLLKSKENITIKSESIYGLHFSSQHYKFALSEKHTKFEKNLPHAWYILPRKHPNYRFWIAGFFLPAMNASVFSTPGFENLTTSL